jgi:hypothetical protein
MYDMRKPAEAISCVRRAQLLLGSDMLIFPVNTPLTLPTSLPPADPR